MSDMLKQAIIDANALKEAAIKNAETLVIEKYSSEIKDTIQKLLSEEEAMGLIVNGFFEPFTRELPMEYAVELNKLLEREMEGSIG